MFRSFTFEAGAANLSIIPNLPEMDGVWKLTKDDLFALLPHLRYDRLPGVHHSGEADKMVSMLA